MPMPIACVYTVEGFVTTEKPLKEADVIPFGLSTIASILKNEGHDIKLIVITSETPLLKTLQSFIERFRPRLFCLTAVSTQFPLVGCIAEMVKNIDPTIFIVLGGSHASLMPENAISCPHLDAICVGEGDTAVIELAAQIEADRIPSGIHNLWFRKRGTEIIEKNPPSPFNNDLDDLPFIDRELWRPWINEPDSSPAVLVGRGCPFRCSYCSNHKLRNLAKGPYVRFRSPANIVAEIEQITRNPRVTSIYLEVETIGSQIDYALQLCQALEEINSHKEPPIQFKINLSVTSQLVRNTDSLTQLLSAFNRSNIVTINIGLESGSERIRNEILRRPSYTNDDIILFYNLTKKFGIKINMYVMMGIPGETVADFKETIQIVRSCEPNLIFLSIFYPYPGTDLFQLAKERGLLDKQTISHKGERKRVYIDLPEFPKRKIMREFIMFHYKVYKGKWSWSKRVIYTIRHIMAVYLILDHLFFYLSRRSRIGKRLLKKYRAKF